MDKEESFVSDSKAQKMFNLSLQKLMQRNRIIKLLQKYTQIEVNEQRVTFTCM